ncbi:MAG: hypothetical protein ACRCW2_00590 [Cellulosilyticaceae bacterium]
MIQSMNTTLQNQNKTLTRVGGQNVLLPVQKKKGGNGETGQRMGKKPVQENLIQKREQRFLSDFANQMSKLYGTAKSMDTIKTGDKWLVKAQVQKSVEALVNQYNETIDFLEGHQDNKTVNRLQEALVAVGDNLKEALAHIGITAGDRGRWTCDMQRLSSAMTTNQDVVKTFLYAAAQGVKAASQTGMTTSAMSLLIPNGAPHQFVPPIINFQA